MKNEIHSIGLDIGTSRVRCVIGEAGEDRRMNIVGVGSCESKDFGGIVTGAEAAAEAVKKSRRRFSALADLRYVPLRSIFPANTFAAKIKAASSQLPERVVRSPRMTLNGLLNLPVRSNCLPVGRCLTGCRRNLSLMARTA